jgi:hypothetical protein
MDWSLIPRSACRDDWDLSIQQKDVHSSIKNKIKPRGHRDQSHEWNDHIPVKSWTPVVNTKINNAINMKDSVRGN